MDYFETAAAVLLAAKELTEQEQYFFFFGAAELAAMVDIAYTKNPDMELDTEIICCLKDTLRTVTNASQIVRSAFMEVGSK